MGIAVIPAAGGGVTQKVQEFTSTGTFTAPSNCSTVEVFLVAGGGGGGGGRTSTSNPQVVAGGGGGGGVVRQAVLPVTPGASYTVTIGAGGAGGTESSGGGKGGDSSFGSLLTCRGGGGSGGRNASTSTMLMGTLGGTGAGWTIQGVSIQESVGGGNGGGAGGSAIVNVFGNNTAGFVGSGGFASTNRLDGGVGGQGNESVSPTTNYQSNGIGIQGYGGGGGGGKLGRSAANSTQMWSYGVTSTTLDLALSGPQAANGQNGTANLGDGGSGGIVYSIGTSAAFTGGNGSSGYARVVYWS